MHKIKTKSKIDINKTRISIYHFIVSWLFYSCCFIHFELPIKNLCIHRNSQMSFNCIKWWSMDTTWVHFSFLPSTSNTHFSCCWIEFSPQKSPDRFGLIDTIPSWCKRGFKNWTWSSYWFQGSKYQLGWESDHFIEFLQTLWSCCWTRIYSYSSKLMACS